MRHVCGIKRISRGIYPHTNALVWGFTLLELLLAVTIFSIIALSLYSSLNAGIRVLKRSQATMRMNQNLRLASEELALELRNAVRTPLYKEKVEGGRPEAEGEEKPGEEEEESVYFFLGEEKRFSFVTLKNDSLCNISYYFNPDGKLMKSARYQSRDFAASPGEDTAVLEGIEAFETSYSYHGADEHSEPEWRNSWELEEMIPMGVKIMMKIKGPGGLRTYTKTVFIPAGKLGTEEGAL